MDPKEAITLLCVLVLKARFQLPRSGRDDARAGLLVDHSTIYWWVQRYAPELEKRCRPHLKTTNDSWRVDETYLKVKGVWMYVYRAVDSQGNTLEFRWSIIRDAQAAGRFFAKALGASHTTTPRVITVDKNAAIPQLTRIRKQQSFLQ